jgi:hypothetical protein
VWFVIPAAIGGFIAFFSFSFAVSIAPPRIRWRTFERLNGVPLLVQKTSSSGAE